MSLNFARAHPFGGQQAAQRLDLSVRRDGLLLRYVLDAPQASLDAWTTPDDPQGWPAILQRGLIISVDGHTLQPEVVASHDQVDRAGQHTRALQLALSISTPMTGVHHIEISNANLPGQQALWYTGVDLAPSAVLTASSLVVTPRGGHTEDLSTRWTRSELRRRITLDVDLPADPWSRAADRALPPIPPGMALPAGPWECWRQGHDNTRAAMLGLLAWLGAGVAAGLALDEGRVARLLIVIGASLAAIGAALVGPPLAPGLLAGWAAGAVAGLALPRPSTAAWRLALLVALSALVLGLLLLRQEPPPSSLVLS